MGMKPLAGHPKIPKASMSETETQHQPTHRDRAFSYFLQYNDEYPSGVWVIYRLTKGNIGGAPANKSKWIVTFPDEPSDHLGEPPAAVRGEYERLNGYEAIDGILVDARTTHDVTIVEMTANADQGYDQPCAHGNRVEDHAVYCHNGTWLYSPTKCRRTKYNLDFRHEDCRGFVANPLAVEEKCR